MGTRTHQKHFGTARGALQPAISEATGVCSRRVRDLSHGWCPWCFNSPP